MAVIQKSFLSQDLFIHLPPILPGEPVLGLQPKMGYLIRHSYDSTQVSCCLRWEVCEPHGGRPCALSINQHFLPIYNYSLVIFLFFSCYNFHIGPQR